MGSKTSLSRFEAIALRAAGGVLTPCEDADEVEGGEVGGEDYKLYLKNFMMFSNTFINAECSGEMVRSLSISMGSCPFISSAISIATSSGVKSPLPGELAPDTENKKYKK